MRERRLTQWRTVAAGAVGKLGIHQDRVRERTGKEPAMAVCKPCNGKGSVKCPKCDGKGGHNDLIFGFAECKNCGGSGQKACSTCGGKGSV
jgi:DnaJ-class molecular chaperone